MEVTLTQTTEEVSISCQSLVASVVQVTPVLAATMETARTRVLVTGVAELPTATARALVAPTPILSKLPGPSSLTHPLCQRLALALVLALDLDLDQALVPALVMVLEMEPAVELELEQVLALILEVELLQLHHHLRVGKIPTSQLLGESSSPSLSLVFVIAVVVVVVAPPSARPFAPLGSSSFHLP